MKLRTTTFVAAITTAIAGLLATDPAQATVYNFSQGGFAGGGSVSGYFIGADGDGDGWIFQYELENFSLSFSGNASVNAFTHSYANGTGPGNFAYKIGSATFDHEPYGGLWTAGQDGDNDGLNSIRYASYEWEAVGIPGMVVDLTNGTSSATSELLSVTAVPEPGTWALMAGGLVLLGFARRRLQASAE